MKRIVGIVLAVLLIGGVAAAVVAGREKQDTSTATRTVRGVIGSEKAEFPSAGALEDGKAKSYPFRGSSSMAQDPEVSVRTV